MRGKKRREGEVEFGGGSEMVMGWMCGCVGVELEE